jgi:hypothetical protein
MLSKRPPKMVLRRMMSPSLETGTVLDVALSGILARLRMGVCDGGTRKM